MSGTNRLWRAGAAAGLAVSVLLLAAGSATASEVRDHIRADQRAQRRLERMAHRSKIRIRQLDRAVRVARRDNEGRPGLATISALREARTARLGYTRWTGERRTRLLQQRQDIAAWMYTYGVFRVCPVDGPRYIHDDFGETVNVGDAPPHVHRGSDVEAPSWTPIRAPFDGYAWGSSSPYGGYQVRVRGDRGYVFVAHLIGYGNLGWVGAGTTVGYVGSTGLSTAPHAHVEWHPWDGGAVDPYYLLRLSCG